MAKGRGAFLVLEGCDRAGKSTQVKMLIDALEKRQIPIAKRSFPDRSTAIGKLLDSFLSKKQDLPPETAHLLFSANRWECKHDILKTLHSGVTLIVDRYAPSGAAYTCAATDRPLAWCKECDRGLPSPDMVVLLRVSLDSQATRAGWGNEHFENTELQRKVASNYEKLKDKTWAAIDANKEVDKIHAEILEKVLTVIDSVKEKPVGVLYESSTNDSCAMSSGDAKHDQ